MLSNLKRHNRGVGVLNQRQNGLPGLIPWTLLTIALCYLAFSSYSNESGEILQEKTTISMKYINQTSAPATRFNRKQMDRIAFEESVWKAPCKNNCNAASGYGKCVSERCVCTLGRGDEDCSFGIETLYDTHEVYKDMELRDLDASGWDNGETLYENLVRSVQPNLVVEVGVWKGSSASKLAAALKAQGSGVLVAIDTWLPVLNFWQDHQAFNRMEDLKFHHGYPDIFHTFTGNMVYQNLTGCVIPFPATSRIASDYFESRNMKAELIHIDAAHSYYDVVEDLQLWWKHLREGGIMLGDDWSEVFPGVQKAVREHARHYQLHIYVFNNKWWIHKPLSY